MTVFVNDTFTDSNGTDVVDHTPETGGAWVLRTGITPEISGNTIIGGNELCYMTNAAAPGNVEYDVQWTVDWDGVGTDWHGLLGRFTDSNNRYIAYTTGATYVLKKAVLGVHTTLDSNIEAFPQGGTACLLEIRDNSQDFKIAGVSKVSAADGALTDVGLAGFFMYSCKAGTTLDTFIGTAAGAPAAENASMMPMYVWWAR